MRVEQDEIYQVAERWRFHQFANRTNRTSQTPLGQISGGTLPAGSQFHGAGNEARYETKFGQHAQIVVETLSLIHI